MMATFGEKLKAIRFDRDLSQEEFGKLLGLSKQQVSRYEKEQTSPYINTVNDIAEKLNIDLNLLIDNKHSVQDVLDYQKTGKYFTRADTENLAQKLYENKNMRLLFDVAKDAAPEDLMMAHNILKALKDKEQRNEA